VAGQPAVENAPSMSLDGHGVRAELRDQGTLLRVLLDRPRGNILTAQVAAEIRAALVAREREPRLKLVYLRGAGGHFSYGASIQEHRAESMAALLAGVHSLARTIAGYPVPVAALVEGKCLGGAFEVALCCHLVFATPGARFAWPEVTLGVFPPLAAALAPMRLGGARAERLILSGEEIDAESLRRTGFLAAVLDDREPELALLRWYGAHLAPLSAFAIRQATRALRAGSDLLRALEAPLARTEAQYTTEVLSSHDGPEGIEAFLAKRAPRWEDR
jgi:cyclohexa-1,5-dienecarbonyl-CoA hydratase